MVGSATCTIVTSTSNMKVPAQIASNVHLLRVASACGGTAAVLAALILLCPSASVVERNKLMARGLSRAVPRFHRLSRQDSCMSESPPSEEVDTAVSDRRENVREGPERRRKVRPELSEAMKAAARLRSRGVCECANPNCWHFHQCKAPAVAFVARRSPLGVLSGVLFCRECARTAGGSEGRL